MYNPKAIMAETVIAAAFVSVLFIIILTILYILDVIMTIKVCFDR